MTLVNGVWYDNELNYKYGDHKFSLLPNSDDVLIAVFDLSRIKDVSFFDEYDRM